MNPDNPRLFFLVALVLVFLILGARLIDLQIIRGSFYATLSSENRIRRIPIRAPRGRILDAQGEVLADNRQVYKLVEFGKNGAPVSYKIIADDEGKRLFERGVEGVIRETARSYPAGEGFAHVLGYVSQVESLEVGKNPCGPYTPAYVLGDFAGRTGIEQEYECLLRGQNGEELVEVDTNGRRVRVLGRREAVAGKDLRVSLDRGLAEVAAGALAEKPGALVAQNPKTGELLALVSSPSFDPNKIAEDFERLSRDENLPLFNRAIGGSYQPGSTFKIVTATAGLEEGKIDANFTFTDPGVIRVGSFSYANWYFTQYGRTEGTIDIIRAIKRSTDTFFYKVGEFVGVEKLAKWAGKFGLGEKTGIDIPGEIGGLVPTPQWREDVIGERWFLGNTYHLSIGQGDIHLTPLQVNLMTSVLASSGKLCRPHVLGKVDCQDIEVSPKTIRLITSGMVEACKPGGTAFPFFNFSPEVACKTGTAEFGDPQGRTHAWLTAFAPADAPEIVVTALVEGGGEGSAVAAPIVREVMDYWFHQR